MNDKNKSIQPTEPILERLQRAQIPTSPSLILKNAEKELKQVENNKTFSSDTISKALTLLEFENGILLANGLPDLYQAFAIQLSQQLQQEYDCKTASEKATAEHVSLCYTKTLIISQKLTRVLEYQQKSKIDILYISILSKEYDRSHRQYLSAVQSLQMMKQSPLNVTIKTQTAIVGQNQIVQANSHE